MQTSALFSAKTSDFSKFMVCPHGQGGGGLSQCGHFSDKERRSIFRDFVRASFTDGPYVHCCKIYTNTGSPAYRNKTVLISSYYNIHKNRKYFILKSAPKVNNSTC